MQPLLFKNIDWNLMWQNAVKKKTRKSKGPDDWDKRAPSFARRNVHSIYNRMFLDLLQPEPEWTVLDVGCGPGTLSIPLAKRVRHVSALDFSPQMLKIIEERAGKEQIANISTHTLSWEDDWREHGIRVHDVTIASRSIGVRDLRAALEKLNRYARKAVAVTDRVGPGPLDPAAFKAVGRELETGPDYIYTVNLLYQMGIHATVNFIRLEHSRPYGSFAEAVDNYTWMFRDLTDEEHKRLEKYVRSIAEDDGNTIILRPQHVTTWAFLRWSP
ncbi:MAG: class I SAM-dependent methyltransferase [Desulfobulbaceae bacterium]|nr:class I SAM-dependent methyltransferase [Desulfobulbaceae bacterium]